MQASLYALQRKAASLRGCPDQILAVAAGIQAALKASESSSQNQHPRNAQRFGMSLGDLARRRTCPHSSGPQNPTGQLVSWRGASCDKACEVLETTREYSEAFFGLRLYFPPEAQRSLPKAILNRCSTQTPSGTFDFDEGTSERKH